MRLAIIFDKQTWKRLYNSMNCRCSISEDSVGVSCAFRPGLFNSSHLSRTLPVLLAPFGFHLSSCFFKLVCSLIHKGTSEARERTQLSNYKSSGQFLYLYSFNLEADGLFWKSSIQCACKLCLLKISLHKQRNLMSNWVSSVDQLTSSRGEWSSIVGRGSCGTLV